MWAGFTPSRKKKSIEQTMLVLYKDFRMHGTNLLYPHKNK
jgi:hypothetical protein